jgi:hypothetical protein
MGCEDCNFLAGLDHAQTKYTAQESALKGDTQKATRAFNKDLGILLRNRDTLRELAVAGLGCDGQECKVEEKIIELALKESENDILQGVYEYGRSN